MEKNISNINIGNCGEYYVAAELERRGFIVAVPMSNVNNFDILAIRKTHPFNQYAIQVKTSTKKDWLLSKKNEKLISNNIFYVFVKLEKNEFPKFYIYNSEDVASFIAKSHQEWLATPGKFGQKHNDNNLRVFICDDDHENKWEYFQ